MCPFCYIGKRKFEQALSTFANPNELEIVWKSFQLSPDIKTDPSKNVNDLLAAMKGIPVNAAKQLNDQVTARAAQVGLNYDFDKAIVANSFMAHRFSHYAKLQGLQDQAEEALFQAYFTDGKNTDDLETLVKLGEEIGLQAQATRAVLESTLYAQEVHHDIFEAHQLGIHGVPFFVFNRKFAVSGAQENEVFTQTLAQSYADWRAENPKVGFEVTDGEACVAGEDCTIS